LKLKDEKHLEPEDTYRFSPKDFETLPFLSLWIKAKGIDLVLRTLKLPIRISGVLSDRYRFSPKDFETFVNYLCLCEAAGIDLVLRTLKPPQKLRELYDYHCIDLVLRTLKPLLNLERCRMI